MSVTFASAFCGMIVPRTWKEMIEYLGFAYQWQREGQEVILHVKQSAG